MAHLNLRVLSDEETGEIVFDYVRPRGLVSPERCTCGRFARHLGYEANTMPHGESVTTVYCTRCGEVEIR